MPMTAVGIIGEVVPIVVVLGEGKLQKRIPTHEMDHTTMRKLEPQENAEPVEKQVNIAYMCESKV